jgi:hypothetical protein
MQGAPLAHLVGQNLASFLHCHEAGQMAQRLQHVPADDNLVMKHQCSGMEIMAKTPRSTVKRQLSFFEEFPLVLVWIYACQQTRFVHLNKLVAQETLAIVLLHQSSSG